MDSICIKDIRAYAYIGFFEAEKRWGQWFSVDLKLDVNLKDASHTDDLDKTVDYGAVVQQTKNLIETAKVNLIETVAENIATNLLQIDLVQGVEVKLTKLAAPIPEFAGTVSVAIYRQNDS